MAASTDAACAMTSFPPICDTARHQWYALGRNAIYAALQSMGVRPCDEVLTPAFDCDGTLQPFQVAGVQLRFYRSNPNTWDVDLEDIQRQLTPRTKLLHVINHFGFPQRWDALQQWRRENGVPILEDNAYSLFSQYQGQPLGGFGDCAIFSLRKNIPILDGGLLVVNNRSYGLPEHTGLRPWMHRVDAPVLLGLIKARCGLRKLPRSLRNVVRRMYPVMTPPPPLYDDAMRGIAPDWPGRDVVGEEFSCEYTRRQSQWGAWQWQRMTSARWDGLIARKRAAYAYVVELVSRIDGVRVMRTTLDEGVVPHGVPLLISMGRDQIYHTLQQRYDVMAWPTLSQAVIDQIDTFPDVQLLGRQLLQLNLSEAMIGDGGWQQRLAACVRHMERAMPQIRDTRQPVGTYAVSMDH